MIKSADFQPVTCDWHGTVSIKLLPIVTGSFMCMCSPDPRYHLTFFYCNVYIFCFPIIICSIYDIPLNNASLHIARIIIMPSLNMNRHLGKKILEKTVYQVNLFMRKVSIGSLVNLYSKVLRLKHTNKCIIDIEILFNCRLRHTARWEQSEFYR